MTRLDFILGRLSNLSSPPAVILLARHDAYFMGRQCTYDSNLEHHSIDGIPVVILERGRYSYIVVDTFDGPQYHMI